MAAFSFDWPETKRNVLRQVKGNRELESFLSGIFDRLDEGLSSQLEKSGDGASLCDQYAAIHSAQQSGKQSSATLRGARWPGGSEGARGLLSDMFRALATEAKPLKKLLLKKIEKIKPDKLLVYKKWLQRRPTGVPTKPLDMALKQWQAATKGNLPRTLEGAKRLPAKEKEALREELDKLIAQIIDATGDLIGKRARQKEHKGLVALMERMNAKALLAQIELKSLAGK
jgi:hypothetical protein